MHGSGSARSTGGGDGSQRIRATAPFDSSPPSTSHAPRALAQRNFTRSTQSESSAVPQVLYTLDTLKTDSFGFVLFMFVFVTTLEVFGLFSIRPPVYGEYVFVF